MNHDDSEQLLNDWRSVSHENDVENDGLVTWFYGVVSKDVADRLNKIDKDMCKKKISDNPYDGETLYAVLRDQILERKGYGTNTTVPNDEMVRELLHTRMEELVPMLVQHELDRANRKFPQFASDMEGWAVLKEEIEEVSEELNAVKSAHDTIWAAIRANEEVDGSYICPLLMRSINLIDEAIQVAAMAMKYDAMIDRKGKEE